jgi:hypothetical protein
VFVGARTIAIKWVAGLWCYNGFCLDSYYSSSLPSLGGVT